MEALMYRSLNIDTLGVSGRQSELIELALTYRFRGIDVDVEALGDPLWTVSTDE